MLETIQAVASSIAVATAFLYILGGLIVNIHLGKYKITEYQIVTIHYLVVGVIFLLYIGFTVSIAIFTAALASIFVVSNPQLFILPLPVLFGISLFSLIILMLPEKSSSRLITNLLMWIRSKPWVFRVATLLYPCAAVLRSAIFTMLGKPNIQDANSAQGMFIFAILVLTYDYAWRVYGVQLRDADDELGLGIGRGTPRRVQLAGAKEDIHVLALAGIPLINTELTDEIFLLAETNNHYIVRILNEDGEAVRVRKEIVSVLMHKRVSPAKSKSSPDELSNPLGKHHK